MESVCEEFERCWVCRVQHVVIQACSCNTCTQVPPTHPPIKLVAVGLYGSNQKLLCNGE